MQVAPRRVLLSLLAAFGLGGLWGCGDDFGQACDMPNTPTFNAYCGADAESGTNATCVLTNNPECTSRMCARYQGSSDFCTVSCDTTNPASTCPSGGICYVQPGEPASNGFCVPRAIYDRL